MITPINVFNKLSSKGKEEIIKIERKLMKLNKEKALIDKELEELNGFD